MRLVVILLTFSLALVPALQPLAGVHTSAGCESAGSLTGADAHAEHTLDHAALDGVPQSLPADCGCGCSCALVHHGCISSIVAIATGEPFVRVLQRENPHATPIQVPGSHSPDPIQRPPINILR